MPRLTTPDPPADGGYPLDGDLHQMTDDGGPLVPDPARWADGDWRDDRGGRDTSADWTPITARMPPEGVIASTITPSGGIRAVIGVQSEGRLWRLPQGTHYPCFSPAYWRLEAPTPVAGPPAR